MRLSSTGAKTTSARQNKKLGKPGFVVRLIFSLAHFLQRLDHALSNRDQIVKIAHRVSTPGKRAHIQHELLFAMLWPAQQPALAIAQRRRAGGRTVPSYRLLHPVTTHALKTVKQLESANKDPNTTARNHILPLFRLQRLTSLPASSTEIMSLSSSSLATRKAIATS